MDCESPMEPYHFRPQTDVYIVKEFLPACCTGSFNGSGVKGVLDRSANSESDYLSHTL